MIDGIIKLFYSEVVKVKMRNLPSGEYALRDEYKDLQNVTLKIDSILLKFMKLMLAFLILILSFKISTVLGIGIFLIEFAYIAYKRNMEKEIKKQIENFKNNIEVSKINFVGESAKTGLNVLFILLIIGIITSFNWSIVSCFIVVFLFTMKDIYSNIK